MKRIVLTGGGTAGHVTPNLALIPHLQREGYEIHYIGTEQGLERGLLANIPGVTYHSVKSGKLRRYFDLKNFTDPFRVLVGAGQAAQLIGKLKPALVFSKGGFVSVPVVWGAWLHHVPVLLHESDMTSGLSNRISLPVARALLTSFPETAKAAGAKGVYTGTPMRRELFEGSRKRGLALCGFDDSRPVVLVTGGSLGAQALNAAVRGALHALLQNFQVLHLCGKGNLDASLNDTAGYKQFEYLQNEMTHAYACADIAVSRAGSNTICELRALAKPSLLVPYPKTASRGDQIINAQSFAERGLAHVLMQEQMTPETLTTAVIRLYHDRNILKSALQRELNADGTARVLEEIRKYALTE